MSRSIVEGSVASSSRHGIWIMSFNSIDPSVGTVSTRRGENTAFLAQREHVAQLPVEGLFGRFDPGF